MIKIKIKFRKTYQRLYLAQKAIIGLVIFLTCINVVCIFLTGLFQFWIILEIIFLTVSAIFFFYFGPDLPFYMTKIELKDFHILGEIKFRKVEKDFLARHLFVRKFKFWQIVSLREYREDGTLFSETPYNRSRIEGEKKIYTISGKLRRSSMYKSGELNGYSKKMTGNYLSSEQHYKKAKLHGITREYDVNTGKLVKEINYNNNKADGIMKIYDPKSGELVEETSYKDGVTDGLSIFYYKTGQLKSETPCKNNVINGTVKIYYKSGILHSETPHKVGVKDGLSKFYYKTG